MSDQLNVLFLPPPPHRDNQYQNDIVNAVGTKHNLKIYDYYAPIEAQFEGVDVVIDEGGSHSTREMADVAYSAKLWQILGSGFDHFDLDYWRQKRIPVANCPGQCSAVALAESALMFLLLLARRWNGTQRNVRLGVMGEPMGLELENRCLGLIGFGASARELARRTKPLGMRTMAIDIREISLEERREFGLEFVGDSSDIDEVVSESDYISLHLHLNDETRHIIDARRLRLMKASACLINVARGALVDEQALYSALREERIAGAGLDVFSTEPLDPNHPLLSLPNVVATPHVAGATNGSSRRRALCVAENVDRIAAGLEPLYRIDG